MIKQMSKCVSCQGSHYRRIYKYEMREERNNALEVEWNWREVSV